MSSTDSQLSQLADGNEASSWSFPQFQKLPQELQLKIFDRMIQDIGPRIVAIEHFQLYDPWTILSRNAPTKIQRKEAYKSPRSERSIKVHTSNPAVLSINAYTREKALKVFTLPLTKFGSTTGTVYVNPVVDFVYFRHSGTWSTATKAQILFGKDVVGKIRYLMVECGVKTLETDGLFDFMLVYPQSFVSLEVVHYLEESDVELTRDGENNQVVVLPENHLTSAGMTVQQIKEEIDLCCNMAFKKEWKAPLFEVVQLGRRRCLT